LEKSNFHTRSPSFSDTTRQDEPSIIYSERKPDDDKYYFKIPTNKAKKVQKQKVISKSLINYRSAEIDEQIAAKERSEYMRQDESDKQNKKLITEELPKNVVHSYMKRNEAKINNNPKEEIFRPDSDHIIFEQEQSKKNFGTYINNYNNNISIYIKFLTQVDHRMETIPYSSRGSGRN
jgi:hypothetical protein